MPENPPDWTSERKAEIPKTQIVAHIARLVRREGMDYDGLEIRGEAGPEGL